MCNRWWLTASVLVLVGGLLGLGPVESGIGQEAKASLAALFEGVPADLRANLATNSVRRDRLNDWLADNVDGKDKVVELDWPVKVVATRDADKTYTVTFTSRFSAGSQPGLSVNALGGTWPVVLKDGRAPGFQGGGSPRGDMAFVRVSTADAEKLVEAKKVHLQGKVKHLRLNTDTITVVLDDVLVDGKKYTPRPEAPVKGKGKSSNPFGKGGAGRGQP